MCRLIEQGLFSRLLPVCERVISIDPDNKKARCYKGICLRHEKKLVESLESIESAINLDRTYAFAWNSRGDTLMAMRRFQEALESFRNAVRLSPAYQNAYSNIGIALYKMIRYNEARDVLRDALKLNATHQSTLLYLGECLVREERHREAVQCFEALLRAGNQSAPVYLKLTSSLHCLGRYQQALDYFSEAAQNCSGQAKFQLAYATYLVDMREYPLAVKIFGSLSTKHPLGQREHHMLAKCYWNLKKYPSAKTHLESAIGLAQGKADQVDLLVDLGLVLHELRSFERAISVFQTALQKAPREALAHFYLGNCFYETGNYEAALTHYQISADCQPNHGAIWPKMALVHNKLGQLRRELAVYDCLLHQWPEDLKVRVRRSDLLKKYVGLDLGPKHVVEAYMANPSCLESLL